MVVYILRNSMFISVKLIFIALMLNKIVSHKLSKGAKRKKKKKKMILNKVEK